MKYYLIYIVFIFLALTGCEKDKRNYSPYLVETYTEFLDSLDLHCPEGESENYFTGIVKNQYTCYKDGIDNYRLRFSLVSSFITDSPTLTIGDPNSSSLYLYKLSFEPLYPASGKESLNILFPYFNPNRDIVEYLDSIFSIKYHKIKSDIDGNEFDRSTSKFFIELRMVDYSDKRAKAFPISTMYGNQDDSYIMIKKVEKRVIFGKINYTLEMNLKCDLYHNPQFGKEGLWGKIEDGKIIVHFSVE